MIEKCGWLLYNLYTMEKYVENWKYYIQTFGCQMNVHESEKIAGVLKKYGIQEVSDPKEAQVVVLNTCAIRESAELKIESFIGNLKHSKEKGITKCVALLGCMTQQDGKALSLKRKFPQIDIILGTHNLAHFEEKFKNFITSGKGEIEILDKRLDSDIEEIYRTSGVNAWVNISFGCNNFCSYCIVPYVRGREVSRKEEDIIRECKDLIDAGYKQITLLGQNVNSYGNDIDDPSVNFPNLLKKIDEIEGEYRLRFMTSHPKDLSDELIETIKNGKHICHSIHLPVQSGSSSVLQRMNRKYTREHYLEIVKKIKSALPDVELTTDIIVGFVGETEEEFEDTLSLIKEVGYQQIFGFIYSKRKGTAAETMEGHLPVAIKKARLAKLIELEREIASGISASYVGKKVRVLIEGTNKMFLVGSTEQNKNINITLPKGSSPEEYLGKFVTAEVTNSKLTVLYGKITKSEE